MFDVLTIKGRSSSFYESCWGKQHVICYCSPKPSWACVIQLRVLIGCRALRTTLSTVLMIFQNEFPVKENEFVNCKQCINIERPHLNHYLFLTSNWRSFHMIFRFINSYWQLIHQGGCLLSAVWETVLVINITTFNLVIEMMENSRFNRKI